MGELYNRKVCPDCRSSNILKKKEYSRINNFGSARVFWLCSNCKSIFESPVIIESSFKKCLVRKKREGVVNSD